MKKNQFLSLIFIVLILSGCTAKTRYSFDDETFHFDISTEPPSLDWNTISDTTSSNIVDNIMDGLTAYNFTKSEVGITPALAESWTISPDGKVYTFKIRKGVKWTDGAELKAKHFADGWKRLVDPKTASPYATYLSFVKNGREISAGKKPVDSMGVEAIDDYTFRVTLENVTPYFLFATTHAATYPIRLDVVEKFGDKWTDAKNIVTLGPFKLKEWNHDKNIILERNDTYWGEKPKIKTMVAQMVLETSTALSLFESGQLDHIQTIPNFELERVKKDPKLLQSLKTGPNFSNVYFGFNTMKPPFNDPNVRKAFASSIDRVSVLKAIRRDFTPLLSWIPTGMLGYNSNIGLKFNPSNAKEYLRAAGYIEKNGKWISKESGKEFPKIRLAITPNESAKILVENLQTQWRNNIGIEPELYFEEWKVYLRTLELDPPEIFYMGWVADYPDPDTFMQIFRSYSSDNRTGWKSAEYDKLVTEAGTTLDNGKRVSLYNSAQRLLAEEANPFIPLYTSTQNYLMKPFVKGFIVNPMRQWRYSGIYLERGSYKD